MALIEAKLGVSWSSIAGNTQGQLHLVTHNIKEQTGADASGDIFHESVHHSLLLFCPHPVKMAEPVQRSLSPGCLSFDSHHGRYKDRNLGESRGRARFFCRALACT
jgi:hypothetical protein